MKIITTSADLINKIENSQSDLPKAVLVSEAIIKIEKDGQNESYRLREFNDKAKKEHLKIMKAISNNKEYSESNQYELDNMMRSIPVRSLSVEEFEEIAAVANEVIEHFQK